MVQRREGLASSPQHTSGSQHGLGRIDGGSLAPPIAGSLPFRWRVVSPATLQPWHWLGQVLWLTRGTPPPRTGQDGFFAMLPDRIDVGLADLGLIVTMTALPEAPKFSPAIILFRARAADRRRSAIGILSIPIGAAWRRRGFFRGIVAHF